MTELSIKHKDIRTLVEKDQVQDFICLVKDKTFGSGKNGKNFLTVLLSDKTGQIDSKIWDNVDILSSIFAVGDLVKVKGVVQVYNQRKQLVIHRLENVTGQENLKTEDYIISHTLPDSKDLFIQLLSYIEKIENQHIRQLCLDCVKDETITQKILKAPAAKSIHHAFQGGLLTHVLSIFRMMESVAQQYTFLNKDFLFFGALFHDLGKIEELDFDSNGRIYYTESGQLLGHMLLSCELIEKKAQKILGFPDELKILLKHIVLSHHGKLEYGSPKLPMFPEAIVVAMIDDFDSKMDQVFQFVQQERQTGERWSRFNEHFERYFYLDNLKEKWQK